MKLRLFCFLLCFLTWAVSGLAQTQAMTLPNPDGSSYQVTICATLKPVPPTLMVSGLDVSLNGIESVSPAATTINAAVATELGRTTIKTVSIAVNQPPPPPPASSIYGPGIGADALVDLSAGRPDNVLDYRFTAPHTGTVASLRLYLIFAHPATTCPTTYRGHYAGGTGGEIHVSLQTDDGTAAHLPSGNEIAGYTITDPMKLDPRVRSDRGSFLNYDFTTQGATTAGTIYHLVFTNVDPNPACNWTDLDNLFMANGGADQVPYFASNLTTLNKGPHTTPDWSVNTKAIPIFDLTYADGTHFGQGYMQVLRVTPTSSSPATEVFTPTSNVIFSNIGVRASGSGNLDVAIYASSGKKVVNGVISSFDKSGWGVADVSQTTLSAGTSYSLQIKPTSGSFTLKALEAGKNYGMQTPNLFPDGHYAANAAYDLPFYLK